MTDRRTERVVKLSPSPEQDYDCPYCEIPLDSEGWYMPGMRPLAELSCSDCGRIFFGDLPSGNALNSPTLLDTKSGDVFQFGGTSDWFAGWLQDSFVDRNDGKYDYTVTHKRPLEQPAFLNCIDALYGHSVLKLLNTQWFIEKTDYDIIVIVQQNLEWIVPDGVAAVITVDIPFSDGYAWDDGIASGIKALVDDAQSVSLCSARPHPHPSTFDISNYTGVEPFPLDGPNSESPTITYVWRDDRFWSRLPSWAVVDDWLGNRLPVDAHRTKPARWAGSQVDRFGTALQYWKVRRLESHLRSTFPQMDFGVAGIAKPGGFPDRITDLRVPEPNITDEQRLCERYAASEVVIGIHGSNMLLPSAHARSTVELLPNRRWGNFLQDILIRDTDAYKALFNTRILPVAITPSDLAASVRSIINLRENFDKTMLGQ